MKPAAILIWMLLVCLVLPVGLRAQTPATSPTQAIVPRLIKFSGNFFDEANHPMKGPVGVTFSLYAQQSGGAALWMETQSVKPDANGNYSILLGANSANGVPEELFATGEARWLGVQVEGQPEQPRVLLVSVPYALKAGDAQTLSGLPASSFALANNGTAGSSTAVLPLAPTTMSSSATAPLATSVPVTTPGGTVNFLSKFFGVSPSSQIENSQIFDNGTDVGIGFPATPTPTPVAKLDVNGTANIRGVLTLPATGTASTTATAGFKSQPLDAFASAFNSSTLLPVAQHFRWQAEAAGSNTSAPSGKFNLLYASGTGTPAETGLSISSKGIVTFATGQTLPKVTGNEAVTGNISATQLISNVATGTPPLQVTSTTQVPNLNASLLGGKAASAFALLGASNNFVGNQSVTGNLTATGTVTGGAADFKGGTATIVKITQTGTGDGMDIFSSGEGIVVQTSGSPGIVTNGGILDSGFVSVNGPASGAMSVTTPGASGTNTTALTVSDTDSNNGDITVGVNARTTSIAGIGVKGTSGASSTTGVDFFDVGVWGDSSVTGNWGVLGTADDGFGVAAFTNSGSDLKTPALEAINETTTSGALVFKTQGTGVIGGPECTIDVNATIMCNGTTITAPTLSGGGTVAFYGVAAAENLFEDFGSGKLSGGVATVALDPTFADAVNTGIGYHVYLTPSGDCKGLYVSQKTPTSFEVHELGGGSSNVAFDYRIVAHRKGYEKVRLEDMTARMKAAAANASRFRRKPSAPSTLRAP